MQWRRESGRSGASNKGVEPQGAGGCYCDDGEGEELVIFLFGGVSVGVVLRVGVRIIVEHPWSGADFIRALGGSSLGGATETRLDLTWLVDNRSWCESGRSPMFRVAGQSRRTWLSKPRGNVSNARVEL